MIQFTFVLLPMVNDKTNKESSETSWRRRRTYFESKGEISCDEIKYKAHKLLINNSNGELHCIRYGADDKNQFIKVLNSNVQLHNISPDYAF